ncbi:membrane protein insertion efficiency factor YidD [Duganella flavida]|uniref:membrane protein insertion efficiency factor YidD n=1 Tax=Duganella flavida TaxID=2692175 RepID=UPI0013705EBB
MKALALTAIKFYQRNISPHKGFCCAYAAYTSDASCSELGYRAIRRFGVWDGLFVLDRRLARCGMANRIAKGSRSMGMRMQRQSGYIDCGGCDTGGCHASGCDTPLGGSNWSCHEFLKILDGCSGCSCDWPARGGAASSYREGTPDNEEAVRRRSRLLREANTPTDPPAS